MYGKYIHCIDSDFDCMLFLRHFNELVIMVNLDDLVDVWHDKVVGMSMIDFIYIATGLSREAIVHWIEKGYLPDE